MATILVRLCALLLLSVSSIAVDDHYISNGTCYYKPGAKANVVYAPVGNIIYGHTYCCALGDKANSNRACYDDSTKYTYLAGCTDPTYEHESCPYKGNYSDYQWVGLSLCEDKGWAGCPNDGSAIVKKTDKSEGCTCDPDKDEMLFDRGGGLDAVGFMPEEEGETISFLPGMKPSVFSNYPTELATTTSSRFSSIAPPTPQASTTPNNSSTVVSAQTSSASSSPAPGPSSTSISTAIAVSTEAGGLSHGAVAGITIGSCASAIMLLTAIFLLLRRRRQRQTAHNEQPKDFETTSSTPDNNSAVPGFSEADSRPSTYAETKSELPGSPVTALSQRESISSQQSGQQPESPSSKKQCYQPYRYQPAGTMHNIQELPNQERPQWAQTGSGTYGPIQEQMRARNAPDGQNNVHELPG